MKSEQSSFDLNDKINNNYNLENTFLSNTDKYNYNKDKEEKIFKSFGSYYTDFMEDKEVSTPMFVDTNDFRTTKTVFVSVDLVLKAGKIHGILFDPFSTYSPLTQYIFDSSITKVPLNDFRDRLKSFSSYKVVIATLKAKQVSILSANDGFGTVLEAVVLPSSFDPETQGLSPLNVNVESKFKLDTIDGRVGMKACLLGSPYIPFTNVTSSQPMTNLSIFFPGTYNMEIPIGTMFYLNEGSLYSNLKLIDYAGNEFTPEILPSGAITRKAAMTMTTTADTYVSIPNQGMKCWIKITPSNQDVTFKITYKVALEVVPGPSLIENVQTYVPPFFYSTQRIFSAINNNYKMLTPLNVNISHAADDDIIMLYKLFKDSLIKKEKEKGKSDVKIKYINDNVSHCSDLQGVRVLKNIRKIIEKENNNQPIIQLPDHIKRAIEFAGVNISKIDNNIIYQRMLRNSVERSPEVNWQFFPTISNTQLVDGIVVVKMGQYANKKIDFKIFDRKLDEKKITLFFDAEDFLEVNKTVLYLKQIILLLNEFYFCQFPEKITIRFFAPFKIEGTSMGASVVMALMNSFPGQYATGELVFDEKGLFKEIKHMSPENIKVKAEKATPNNFIYAPCKNNNMGTYMISGLMADVAGPSIYTYESLDELILFSYIIPRAKGMTRNQLSYLTNDINSFITNNKIPNYRKFIYLMLYAPIEIITNYISDNNYLNKLSIPIGSFEKTNPENYSKYVVFGTRVKRYADIDEVIKKDPSCFLNAKVLTFRYKNQNYYFLPTVRSCIPKEYRKELTPEIEKEINEMNEQIKKITPNEIKEYVTNNFPNIIFEKNVDKKYVKMLNEERLLQPNKILDEELNKEIEHLKKFFPILKEELSLIPSGNNSLFDIPEVFEAFSIKARTNSRKFEKLKKDPLIKYFNSLSRKLGPDEFKKLIIDSKITTGTRPYGSLDIDKTKKILNKYNDKYKGLITKVHIEESQSEKSSDESSSDTEYIKKKNIKNNINKNDEMKNKNKKKNNKKYKDESGSDNSDFPESEIENLKNEIEENQ